MNLAARTFPEEGGKWHAVGTQDTLFSNVSCCSVLIEGRRIGLFRVQNIVYAIDDICSHGNARLSEGELDGFEIECPLHAGLFDIRDGRALCAPLTRDVVVHEVRIEEGQVCVRLTSS